MSQLLTSISKLNMDCGQDGAVGDVFIAKPKPELKSRLGAIVGLIELFGQTDEFIDKFFEIINDLETEYYLPPLENEGGIEKRFEECLKRANRRLNKIINDSVLEVELKNINALVGLISRNKIYLSQIGQNNALLFHRKKKYDYLIVDIFAQASDKAPKINQEKLFSNIISGTLTEKDHLFLCNDSILEYLSQNELMEIITQSQIVSALKEIESALKKESLNNNFYALAVEPIIKEEETAPSSLDISQVDEQNSELKEKNRLPSQTSINKLISTQENTEKYLAPSLAPNWKKAGLVLFWLIKKTSGFIFKYLKIGALELGRLIKLSFIYLQEKTPQLASLISSRLSKSKKHQGLSSGAIKPAAEENDKENKDLLDNYPPEEESRKTLNYHSPSGRGLNAAISRFLNQQIAKFVSLNKLQQILLITASILIFFFSQSMVWQGQVKSASEKTGSLDLLKQIEDSLNMAEAQNIFNDEKGAKQSLAQALDLMSQLPNSKKYKDDKEKIQKRIDDLQKLLQKIAYLENLNTVADLSQQNPSAAIAALAKASNYIFAFDNQNQNIYRIDLVKKQTLARQLPSNFNGVRKIMATDENNIIILNGSSELYKYNWETNLAENNLINSETITDLSVYGGKLYSLKADQDQIFKHFPISGGFNSGSAWIKDGTDVKKAVALAIDGGIYTIDSDGAIKYLLNGRAQIVNFSALTTPLNSPKQIESESDSNYLFILDQNNQRVAVLEKNSGNVKIQYLAKEFADLKSMIVESHEKKIYLLSDKKIYLIDISI